MRILNFLGQGRYHTEKEIPCQDSLLYRQTKNGRWVFAVSDGCSSSKFSHFGSKAVVKAVADFFENYEGELSDSNLKQELLDYMVERLKAKGRQLRTYDLSDLYATVVFLVSEKGKFLAGHIGDGALVCFGEAERLFISDPENAGAANVTYFVGSESAGNHFHLSLIDAEGENQLRNLILFSDGPQKMFAEKGRGDITKGVTEIISKVRAEEINSYKSLKEYLFGQAVTSIYDIDDDWSLIVVDTELDEAEKEADFKADHMTLSFYEKYLEQNPDAAAYVIPKINKFRAELNLEPLAAPKNKELSFEALFEKLQSEYDSAGKKNSLESKDVSFENVNAPQKYVPSEKGKTSVKADEAQHKETEISGQDIEDDVFEKLWKQAWSVQTAVEEAGHFEPVTSEKEDEKTDDEISGFLEDFIQALNTASEMKPSQSVSPAEAEEPCGKSETENVSFEERLEKIRANAHVAEAEDSEIKTAQSQVKPKTEKQSVPDEKQSVGADAPSQEAEAKVKAADVKRQGFEKISVAPESIANFLAPDESNNYDSDAFFGQRENEKKAGRLKSFFKERFRRVTSEIYDEDEDEEEDEDFYEIFDDDFEEQEE